MAYSFGSLRRILNSFEQEQFDAIRSCELGGIPDGVAHGGVQFVSIEPGRATSRATQRSHSAESLPGDETMLPVVVAIGINYCQDPRQTESLKLHRWLQVNGQPTVVDHFPQMRDALGQTLVAYRHNPQAWSASLDCRSAHACSVPPALAEGSDYILIATNFCPLITIRPWSKHDPNHCQSLLNATRELTHLTSLVKLIGNDVDLWVGHGKQHWPRFDELRCQMASTMRNWMVSYNLTGRMAACVANARRRHHPLYR